MLLDYSRANMLLDYSLASNAASMSLQLPAAAVQSGGFDCKEDAARAHDVMAMKCRGVKSTTNFDHKDYEHLQPRLERISKVGRLFPPSCPVMCLAHLQTQTTKYLTSPSNAASYTLA